MKLQKRERIDKTKENRLRLISLLSVSAALFLLALISVSTIIAKEYIKPMVSFNEETEEEGAKKAPLQKKSLQKESEPKKNIEEKKVQPIRETQKSEEAVVDKKDIPKKKGKKNKKKAEKKGKRKKDTLIIGDSVAYGMSLNNTYTGVDRVNEFYWLTEGGVGIRFIPESLKITLGKTMPGSITNTVSSSVYVDLKKEIKDKKIKNVAIMLGINGSGKKYAEETILRMKEIEEKTGCNVFFISLLPVVDAKAKKYGYLVRNTTNTTFNRWMKDGLKDSTSVYVDAYSELTKNSDYVSRTSDGIHYGKEVYNKVIETLIKKLEEKENQILYEKKWKGEKKKKSKL